MDYEEADRNAYSKATAALQERAALNARHVEDILETLREQLSDVYSESGGNYLVANEMQDDYINVVSVSTADESEPGELYFELADGTEFLLRVEVL